MENNAEHMLQKELDFMYNRYEALCVAYKKLAKNKGLRESDSVNDMSNMYFNDKKGE